MSLDVERPAALARLEAAKLAKAATRCLDRARDHAAEPGGDERYIEAGRAFISTHGRVLALKQAALKMDEHAAELCATAMEMLGRAVGPAAAPPGESRT